MKSNQEQYKSNSQIKITYIVPQQQMYTSQQFLSIPLQQSYVQQIQQPIQKKKSQKAILKDAETQTNSQQQNEQQTSDIKYVTFPLDWNFKNMMSINNYIENNAYKVCSIQITNNIQSGSLPQLINLQNLKTLKINVTDDSMLYILANILQKTPLQTLSLTNISPNFNQAFEHINESADIQENLKSIKNLSLKDINIDDINCSFQISSFMQKCKELESFTLNRCITIIGNQGVWANIFYFLQQQSNTLKQLSLTNNTISWDEVRILGKILSKLQKLQELDLTIQNVNANASNSITAINELAGPLKSLNLLKITHQQHAPLNFDSLKYFSKDIELHISAALNQNYDFITHSLPQYLHALKQNKDVTFHLSIEINPQNDPNPILQLLQNQQLKAKNFTTFIMVNDNQVQYDNAQNNPFVFVLPLVKATKFFGIKLDEHHNNLFNQNNNIRKMLHNGINKIPAAKTLEILAITKYLTQVKFSHIYNTVKDISETFDDLININNADIMPHVAVANNVIEIGITEYQQQNDEL